LIAKKIKENEEMVETFKRSCDHLWGVEEVKRSLTFQFPPSKM